MLFQVVSKRQKLKTAFSCSFATATLYLKNCQFNSNKRIQLAMLFRRGFDKLRHQDRMVFRLQMCLQACGVLQVSSFDNP